MPSCISTLRTPTNLRLIIHTHCLTIMGDSTGALDIISNGDINNDRPSGHDHKLVNGKSTMSTAEIILPDPFVGIFAPEARICKWYYTSVKDEAEQWAKEYVSLHISRGLCHSFWLESPTCRYRCLLSRSHRKLGLDKKGWLEYEGSELTLLAASFCPDSSAGGFRIMADFMSWVSMTHVSSDCSFQNRAYLFYHRSSTLMTVCSHTSPDSTSTG